MPSPVAPASSRPWAMLAAVAVALAFTSVSVQWESSQILPWLVRGLGTVAALALMPIVAKTRLPDVLARSLDRAATRPGPVVIALAGASLAVTVLLAYFVLHPFPHVPDGFSYLFQAQLLASGRFFAPAPGLPEFFPADWVAIHHGRWFSIFPPGWPALLALGAKAGAPALVNPLLGAMSVIVLARLGSTLFSTRHGLSIALLCCLSPFFLFMSAEFMSHTATLLFTALSAWCALRAAANGFDMRWSLGSGAASAAAFLVRPPDSLALWTAQTAYLLWRHRSARAMRAAVWSGLVLSIGVALYVAYNRLLVGEWFVSPLQIISPRNRLGFGADIGYDWGFDVPGHSPWRALLNLNFNAAVMNQDLFGWPIPCLLFALLPFALGRTDWRHRFCAWLIASEVAGYALYWYHGVILGARFYFPLLPFVLLLTVEGMRQTPEMVRRWFPRQPADALARQTLAFVALCTSFGLLVYIPKVSLVAPYHYLRGITPTLYERTRAMDDRTPTLVFVHAERELDYGPAFVRNHQPLDESPVVYAFDRGPAENQRLIDALPGRVVQTLDVPVQSNAFADEVRELARRFGLLR